MPAVKESSDELNPSVATAGGFIGREPRRKSLSDFLALALATCGVGYLPVAPGTWGSLVGVGIYLLAAWAHGGILAHAVSNGWNARSLETVLSSSLLVLLAAVMLAGVWAASRAEKLLKRKDPGPVVIDEVAGQLITLLAVPFTSRGWTIFAAFIAFRLFDIWKPYPVRRLEALESGLGIMADDVLAGAYAAILMSIVVSISTLL